MFLDIVTRFLVFERNGETYNFFVIYRDGLLLLSLWLLLFWTNLFTVVSKSDIGYWSFLKITLKRSISLEKSCHEEESLNPLYSMVLRRDFLYQESTWLWKWSRSPLSVGFPYTSVWRTQPLLMIRIPKKGRLSSTAVSIVNSNDGWVSFSTRRKDSAASMLFAMARESSTYLL